ncbi:Phosphoglycerate mutase [Paucilactobacillus oligofermentans DSM 15707 = LMG 22743]|uniref:Phosphoglycerate mutase n=1 Tax=Paucilactobacillus oligofermentans DSM 15707 = LMG 22743 TaxID=1423778 RepID=A0A0R1REY5_9LACO|nr:histidine phosphatase family protein [Paucilactobacillus oligofermentans]KRL55292.1 Phosphoglycerate mutase [Paucilactobacillus oligofermentans DSM 15707 = LMG 22743]CUS25717.1 2,3-bisphosphoglycerate-dependent phosphoglycerate mutase 2 GpmA2 [Paucilactobacillus oligofermentans DSM 15707 = LMG 22743]
MAINVYFVRHGQTYLNKYDRLQGWSDAPLTEKGLTDGTHAGQALSTINFDYAFSSDLARTITTAKLILAENPSPITEPTPSSFFREEFFGYFEGADGPSTWNYLGRPYGYNSFSEMIAGLTIEKTRDIIAAADTFGDAEDDATFQARMDQGLALLRQQPDNTNVLVVSHGTTIRSLVSRFAPEYNPTSSPVNGSITKFSLTPTETKVDFFNLVSLPK